MKQLKEIIMPTISSYFIRRIIESIINEGNISNLGADNVAYNTKNHVSNQISLNGYCPMNIKWMLKIQNYICTNKDTCMNWTIDRYNFRLK